MTKSLLEALGKDYTVQLNSGHCGQENNNIYIWEQGERRDVAFNE
jgi:hypothetical protein